MKGTLIGPYKNSNGVVIFRYAISGSKSELATYKEIQGEHYREDDDNRPLFFSSTECRKSINLGITSDGKRVYIDRTDQHKLAAAIACAEGSGFEDELKKVAAAKFLADIFGSNGLPSSTDVPDGSITVDHDADDGGHDPDGM